MSSVIIQDGKTVVNATKTCYKTLYVIVIPNNYNELLILSWLSSLII